MNAGRRCRWKYFASGGEQTDHRGVPQNNIITFLNIPGVEFSGKIQRAFDYCAFHKHANSEVQKPRHFTPHGRYELNKLTSLPMCDFIAQLVEQRTGDAEVTGSNPVEALIFFRLLLSNCLNWKIYCDDHSSLSYILFPAF